MDKSKDHNALISNSIFRAMFKRNAFILSLVFVISIGVGIFLCHHVLESKYLVSAHLNLKKNDKIISSQSHCHQHLIRILKSADTRKKLIDKHRLLEAYKIDTTNKYYSIQLDKRLFDDLKVEEQGGGTILISFVHENPEKSVQVITDLIDLGMEGVNLHLSKDILDANIVFLSQDLEETKIYPGLLSITFLILVPGLLTCIIFIAIKEKLYLNLNLENN